MFPDDPFTEYLEELDTDFFSYLNWAIPLDNMLNITIGWVACMLAALLIVLIKEYIVDVIIDKILSLTQFFTFLQ